MLRRSDAVLVRYVVAVLAIVLATGVRWGLSHWQRDSYPFAAIFLAVVFSAWYGGFGPAVLAALLGLATTWLVPDNRPNSGPPILGLLFYAIFSLVIALLGGLVFRARSGSRGRLRS